MAREPARAVRSAPAKRTRKVASPKIIERETPQAAAKRALANLEAAESRRGKTVAVVQHDPAIRNGGTAKPVTTQLEFDLDAALEKLNLDFIECRDIGHPWRKASTRWMKAENAWEQAMVCGRCGTRRTRWLSRTGSILGGGYDYADGYQLKGSGRLVGTDRDKVRLASILGDKKAEQ